MVGWHHQLNGHEQRIAGTVGLRQCDRIADGVDAVHPGNRAIGLEAALIGIEVEGILCGLPDRHEGHIFIGHVEALNSTAIGIGPAGVDPSLCPYIVNLLGNLFRQLQKLRGQNHIAGINRIGLIHKQASFPPTAPTDRRISAIKYNEPHNSSYRIFVAEVASTVNELLMAHKKLRESASDEEKMYILNQLMETYKGTLYRQTMFAEFERDIHAMVEKGEPLTAEVINKKYYKLVKRYFGKDVAVDKQIAYEWMRIPHFYTCFYVYKYSTCISAASAIVKRIESEGEAYVSQYIDFLKCGNSHSPLDSLLVAGIDMTKPEVITSAIDDFADCVKQFRELYEKNNG